MKIRYFTILLGLFALTVKLASQTNTIYYLSGAPQAYTVNPATQPRCNYYMGFTHFHERVSTSVGLSDLIWYDQELDSVIHPFHSNANLDTFMSNFVNEKQLAFQFSLTPSFGFRVRNFFFTLDITPRIKQSLYFPGEFFTILAYRNSHNETHEFNSLNFDLSIYNEIAVGISYNISDVLQLGIRPKLLTGIVNLSSSGNSIGLSTSAYSWDLNSTINASMSIPGLIIPQNVDGALDVSGEFRFDSTLTFKDYRKQISKNRGFGIDIGAHFKPVPILTVSASLIDLGYINWTNNVNTSTLESNLTFDGVDLTRLRDSANFMGNLLDTIRGSFNSSGNSDPYRRRLEPRFYVGGNLSVLPMLDVGILSRFDFLYTKPRATVMLHANWHPKNWLNVAVNYNPFDNNASTFGLGLMWRVGPSSSFIIWDYRAFRYNVYKYQFGDDIPIIGGRNLPVYFAPSNRERHTIQAGTFIMFGYNKKKKEMKDKPMYLSTDYY